MFNVSNYEAESINEGIEFFSKNRSLDCCITFPNGCILWTEKEDVVTGSNPYGQDVYFNDTTDGLLEDKILTWLLFWNVPKTETGMIIH